jgi:hypothetical protein
MDLFRRRSTKAPAPELAAKGQFRAKATENLEMVAVKLQAVEAEITAAEGELSKVSLAAVLADDQATGFQAVSTLNELRTRRELLRHALSAAQQAENERLAGLRSRADKANERAHRQHLGTIERHAISVAAAQAQYRDSFRQLVQAAASARATLPKQVNGHIREGIGGQLSADSLRFFAEVAAYGLSQGGIAAPGCTRAPPNAHTIDGWSGHYPGLVELVGSRIVEPLKRLLEPAALNSPQDTGSAGATLGLASAAQPAGSSFRRVEDAPASLNGIASAVPPVGADAPALAELQPLAGGGAAQTLPPSNAGVVIRNGALTNSAERMAPPDPWQEETPGDALEELISDAGEDTTDSETTPPAPFVAPRYTEAEAY